MASSDVEVCNLAMQKLGQGRIASLTENSVAAEECNACYAHIRKTELRRANWNFARTRVALSASATAPIGEDFARAFPLPADNLRILPPNDREVDWQVENHLGQNAILTNWDAPLYLTYIADITDPTRWDDLFTEMVACKIAMQTCRKITGSDTAKSVAMSDYAAARNEAKRINAFEKVSEEPPEDDWVAARR